MQKALIPCFQIFFACPNHWPVSRRSMSTLFYLYKLYLWSSEFIFFTVILFQNVYCLWWTLNDFEMNLIFMTYTAYNVHFRTDYTQNILLGFHSLKLTIISNMNVRICVNDVSLITMLNLMFMMFFTVSL